jgi:hypothetical protein
MAGHDAWCAVSHAEGGRPKRTKQAKQTPAKDAAPATGAWIAGAQRPADITAAAAPPAAPAAQRLYKVQAIVGRRWVGQVVEYRTLWEGYPPEDATWEPLSSFGQVHATPRTSGVGPACLHRARPAT